MVAARSVDETEVYIVTVVYCGVCDKVGVLCAVLVVIAKQVLSTCGTVKPIRCIC